MIERQLIVIAVDAELAVFVLLLLTRSSYARRGKRGPASGGRLVAGVGEASVAEVSFSGPLHLIIAVSNYKAKATLTC